VTRRRNERCVGWSYRVTLRTGEVFFDILSGRGDGFLTFQARGAYDSRSILSMRASGVWIGYSDRRGRYRPGAEMAINAMATSLRTDPSWAAHWAGVYAKHRSEYDAIFGSK